MQQDGRDGRVTMDAPDLAPLIGCAPEDVPKLMRQGQTASIFETGEGEDSGRFRITFRHRATRVRLTCAADGTVLSHIRTLGAERQT